MTPPSLRALLRAGVRQSVAVEYRRLLSVGVSPDIALVLAAGRGDGRHRPRCRVLALWP